VLEVVRNRLHGHLILHSAAQRSTAQ
jgi:hypothetical protein